MIFNFKNLFYKVGKKENEGEMDETELEIEELDDDDDENQLPKRIKMHAKVNDLEFEFFLNQMQGIINKLSIKNLNLTIKVI